MKYKILLTEQARIDLKEIYEHIAFILLKPEIAAAQLKRIEKAMQGLQDMPKRFKVFENEPWHSRGIHQMPVDNFLVFYVLDSKSKIVSIIRIIYARRDIEKQLSKF